MEQPRRGKLGSSLHEAGLPFSADAVMHREEPLDTGFIRRTLDLYQPEFLTILKATWTEGELMADIAPPNYPFTRPGHIDYVTTSTAFLIASQAGYLTCRYLILNSLAVRKMGMSDDGFFTSRDCGDIVFLRADTRFRGKISCSSEFRLIQSVDNVRLSRGRVFARLTTDFDAGQCRISGTLSLPAS